MENIELIMQYLSDNGVNNDIVAMLFKKQILQSMLKNINITKLAHNMQQENLYDINKVVEIYEDGAFAIFSTDEYSRTKNYLVEQLNDSSNYTKIKVESVIGYEPPSLKDLNPGGEIYKVEEQVLDMYGNIMQSSEHNITGFHEIKRKIPEPNIIEVVQNSMEDIEENKALNEYLIANGLDRKILSLPFFKEYFGKIEQYMIENHGIESFDDGIKKKYRPIYLYDEKTGILRSKGRGDSEIHISIDEGGGYILEEISSINTEQNLKFMMDFPVVDVFDYENKGISRQKQSKIVYHINEDGIVQSKDMYEGISYGEDMKLKHISKKDFEKETTTHGSQEIQKGKKKISLKSIKEAVEQFFDREKE